MLAVSLLLGSLPQLSTTPLGKHRAANYRIRFSLFHEFALWIPTYLVLLHIFRMMERCVAAQMQLMA